ncbi:MAG: elongation factor Tu, partial [Candidatus Dormibacteraeota bacterium]|nr:elongation factor Tu [Candidatus Dormibacteraeota bacterium]
VEQAGAGPVVPGETVEITAGLGRPVALSEDLGFAMREGGRTIGAGAVTRLLD